MEIKTASVIGLGLIGGSLAKALRRVGSVNIVIGVDPDRQSLETALSEGVLDRASTSIDENIYDSDIVFICTPIDKIVDSIQKVIKAVKPGCIITDTGSIKGTLVRRIEKIDGQLNFIGGHPMCGSEKYGYEASKIHLFENAYYILTPCDKTTDEIIKIMEKIIIEIGGIPVIIDNRKHDIITGTISHVPHIISAALVNLVEELDCKEGYMQKLVAGGFKDITRISSSKPEMWQTIVLNNKEHIKQILDLFLERVRQFNYLLESDNAGEIFSFFNSAKKFRDTFTSSKVGLITPFNDISIDIEDKPGELGKLTTLLGENGINIKNINISNSREYDHGCLKITFSDIESVDKAYNLLKSHGYKVYKI